MIENKIGFEDEDEIEDRKMNAVEFKVARADFLEGCQGELEKCKNKLPLERGIAGRLEFIGGEINHYLGLHLIDDYFVELLRYYAEFSAIQDMESEEYNAEEGSTGESSLIYVLNLKKLLVEENNRTVFC